MPVQKIGEANPLIPGLVIDAVLDLMRVETAGIAEAEERAPQVRYFKIVPERVPPGFESKPKITFVLPVPF